MAKDKLVTSGYCLILAANFLLYFAFYLILPVLPFYLTEVFHTGNAAVGVILSCYTIASLCIRPFSGYLLDTLARKPLYLVAYFIFITIFAGYMLAGVLSLFIMLRVVHGLAFGMVTVAGNTIVIDITPSSRRGEAVGYYGLMNNTAMSFGPMIGLFMHDIYSFETIFACSLISGTIGLTRTYVAMYAKEIGITLNSGLFFTFMAVGMAVSRMFSGKQVDKGRITQVITLGLYLVCSCFFILSACGLLMKTVPELTNILFFMVALLLGVGFGTMFPAFNTLFVNLAPNNQRGTATSTYLTSWDVGIGIGLTAGGYIAQITSFDMAYFFGACLTVISIFYFNLKVSPHYHKNKLR